MRANLIRCDAHKLDALVIGVDPGISGALVLIDPATMLVWKWADMPIAESNGKRSVSAAMLALTIAEWRSLAEKTGRRLLAIVEEVGAMPGQGVTSMFNFGQAYGFVKALAYAAGVPVSFVRPNKWKVAVGIPAKSEKGASRLRASQLFPQHAESWKLVKHDGRAEALLIAYYGGQTRT